jgi:hypothetical protein
VIFIRREHPHAWEVFAGLGVFGVVAGALTFDLAILAISALIIAVCVIHWIRWG